MTGFEPTTYRLEVRPDRFFNFF